MMKTLSIIFLAAFLALVGSTGIFPHQHSESSIHGIVSIVPKAPVGTWIVTNGSCKERLRAVKVNAQTLIEEENGQPVHGSFVEIVGHQEGGYFVASMIRVESSGHDTAGSRDNDRRQTVDASRLAASSDSRYRPQG